MQSFFQHIRRVDLPSSGLTVMLASDNYLQRDIWPQILTFDSDSRRMGPGLS